MMSLRSAYVLVMTVLLSLACAQAGAAPPALPVRNGDVLYSKQLVKPTARALDLYANWFADGHAMRLTRTPKSHELDPAASPDGRLIAYTRISLARPGSQIWAVRKDGSHQRFLARGSEPAWSPDGKRIVFVGPRQPRVQARDLHHARRRHAHPAPDEEQERVGSQPIRSRPTASGSCSSRTVTRPAARGTPRSG